MIALTIFAVISTLAWQILDGAMRTSSATDASAAKLNQLQRGWSLMERDFFQLQARAPRNEPDLFRQEGDALELTTLNGVSGTVQLERVRWHDAAHLPDGVEVTLTMENGDTWRWVFTTPGDMPEVAAAAAPEKAADAPATTPDATPAPSPETRP